MQQPYFALDHQARTQIRETRATLLEHLATKPDDLTALVMADVLCEIDPDRDPALASHRARFRATRGADWRVQACERGIHLLLFRLAHGFAEARIGRDAVPVLERWAVEISEARPSGVPAGAITAAMIPEALSKDPRVQIAFHPSGHLARVALHIDRLHEGELELAEQPGAGSFSITQKLGGYGTLTRESYADGNVITTLNTPWHDGEESRSPSPWTKWVLASLGELASLAERRQPRRRSARRRSRA